MIIGSMVSEMEAGFVGSHEHVKSSKLSPVF